MHETYIKRCFQLALNGAGSTYPNPVVGAVIVYKGEIIGEGWHRKAGEPHAEVMAVRSVKDKSLLKRATLYVNLEPCSFYGRTPACSRMIIEEGIPRVVISNLDPNPNVAGNGVKMLEEAGVKVITGILENEGKELNRIFFTNQLKKRPYVVIKWAQTSDGYIAGDKGKTQSISNVWSRQLVHKWRSEFETILIGKNTLENDNPRLDTRLWAGRNPVPVVLGFSGKLYQSNLYKIHPKIYVADATKHLDDKKLKVIPETEPGAILKHLFDEGFSTVFIEGGTQTIHRFLSAGLWDEIRVFTSAKVLKNGLPAPQIPLRSRRVKTRFISGDVLDWYVHPENAFVYEGRYL